MRRKGKTVCSHYVFTFVDVMIYQVKSSCIAETDVAVSTSECCSYCLSWMKDRQEVLRMGVQISVCSLPFSANTFIANYSQKIPTVTLNVAQDTMVVYFNPLVLRKLTTGINRLCVKVSRNEQLRILRRVQFCSSALSMMHASESLQQNA